VLQWIASTAAASLIFSGVFLGLLAPTPRAGASYGVSTLNMGSSLSIGQSLWSPSGAYFAEFQGDGNFVVYTAGNIPLWSTGTGGRGATAVVFQTDGNLVVYAGGTPLWSSASYMGAGGTLVMQDDGDLVVYNASSYPIWSSMKGSYPTPTAASPSSSNTLSKGHALYPGGTIWSPSGESFATFQSDGNFVVYTSTNVPLWASGTGGQGGTSLQFQTDGNLVVYAGSSPLWATNTNVKAGITLTMGNDANLVMTNLSGDPLWSWMMSYTASAESYAVGELYGASNPGEICYACQAANIPGAQAPNLAANANYNVNRVTGDFSTTNTLFKASSMAGDLSYPLSYDALQAQNEVSANWTYPGTFGWGWNSPDWVTLQTSGSTKTVNQVNGAQVTFTNVGSSSNCPLGDYPYSAKYTVQNAGTTSHSQWCAASRVQAQLADYPSSTYAFESQGGASFDMFFWNGTLDQRGTATTQASNTNIQRIYNVAPGSTPSSSYTNSITQACPSSTPHGDIGCDASIASDGRDVLDVINPYGLVVETIDPTGQAYVYSYDSNFNLVQISEPGATGTSNWTYLYNTGFAAPYNHEMAQIFDPDATSTSYSPGAAHSTAIQWGTSGTNLGMVASTEDGPGGSGFSGSPATTSYSYEFNESLVLAAGLDSIQQTTVTYPPSIIAGPSLGTPSTEVDSFLGGIESSSTIGSTTSGDPNTETWAYQWTLGNGLSIPNSTETITYPNAIARGTPAQATLTLDSAGNLVSMKDALGNISISTYNDSGGNNLPELLTSTPPGSSSSATYTYDSLGHLLSATDPMGDVTSYGYYASSGLVCWMALPTVNTWGSNSVCSGNGTGGPGSSAPVGATTLIYDPQGDVINKTVDAGDSGGNADLQTTTYQYDRMDDQLYVIPPAGQSSGSTTFGSNPFETKTLYTNAFLPSQVTKPDQGTTTNTYDAANNLVESTNSGGPVTLTAYDGDNRPCYRWVTSGTPSLPSCSTGVQAGATLTNYEPGTTNTYQVTDARGKTTSYLYSDLAFPNSATEVVSPVSSQDSYSAYDDLGNVCVTGSAPTQIDTSTQCNGVSGDTTMVYNILGAETSIVDPSGDTTNYAYTDPSFDTKATSMSMVISQSTTLTTSYFYDAAGRKISMTNPDGTQASVGYDQDSRVCWQSPTRPHGYCGGGPGELVPGISLYQYNNAGELVATTENAGQNGEDPPTISTYTYSAGQMISTSDPNGVTVSYLYGHGGEVLCEAYPVSVSSGCGSISSPGAASTSNTIVTSAYDTAGRLSTVSDWLGNTTSYTYADAWLPSSTTKITSPSSTINYGYDEVGNLTSMTSGSTINDAWTYNDAEQVATTTVNGSTSGTVAYNGNKQITAATNLGTSTSNDSYTLAKNGEITNDAGPSSTSSSAYNAGAQICWNANVSVSSPSCSSQPTAPVVTAYTYWTNGQRKFAATTTTVGSTQTTATTESFWNPYGQLTSMNCYSGACTTPNMTYSYNGRDLRVIEFGGGIAVNSTWNAVGSIPLNINDQTTINGALFVPPGPPSVPSTPSIQGTAGGLGTGSIWWAAPSNTGGSSISSYQVTLSPGGATCTTSTNSCTISGLSAGTTYAATAIATNATGTSAASSPMSFTTTTSTTATSAPSAPLSPAATAGPGSGAISWTAPSSNGGGPITSYMATVSPGGQGCTTTSATSCTISGLTPNLHYTVTVSASNGYGTSVASSSVGFWPNSVVSNTSYIYGNLLFGGTAPIEQITTPQSGSPTASFIAATPVGVQGVFSSSGSVQELAWYSVYGTQTITSGSRVTPFGFQGSYTDSSGLIYLVNRYYDPSTDQFLSIDPKVAQTDQPYVFTNDNSLNATDPLGLYGYYCMGGLVTEFYQGIRYGLLGAGACGQTTLTYECDSNDNACKVAVDAARAKLAGSSDPPAYIYPPAPGPNSEVPPAPSDSRPPGVAGDVLHAVQSLGAALGGGPQMSQVPFKSVGGGSCVQGSVDGIQSWSGITTVGLLGAAQLVPGANAMIDFQIFLYGGAILSAGAGCGYETGTGQSTP
jgi:RHS repeat-associated protein